MDVIIVPDPNGPSLGEPGWPSELWIAKAAIEDEELTSLAQGGASLDEGARGFTRLDDEGGLGQRRHGDVALGEEKTVAAVILRLVALQGHLADDEEVLRKVPLQLVVVFGIDMRKRRTEDRDGVAVLL